MDINLDYTWFLKYPNHGKNQNATGTKMEKRTRNRPTTASTL